MTQQGTAIPAPTAPGHHDLGDVIRDAPIRPDSIVELEQIDPDGDTIVRLDGAVLGEWPALAAHDIETGLHERIRLAQLVAIDTVTVPIPHGGHSIRITWHVEPERFDAILAAADATNARSGAVRVIPLTADSTFRASTFRAFDLRVGAAEVTVLEATEVVVPASVSVAA